MYACIYVSGLKPGQLSLLLDCAGAFSPLAETGSDRVVIDLRGLAKLLGNPREIAERIALKLADAGLQGNIAVASSPHTAAIAARGIEGITIISPGDEARSLARLPLSLLDPEPEISGTLVSWGIHTLGDLSRLPGTGLAERLGPEGVRLHMLAQGLSPCPLVTRRQQFEFTASLELDYALDSLESLAFLLGRLLNEICSSLVSHGLAAQAVIARLGLENRTDYERRIHLPFATTNSASLLKLLQYDLAAHPPQSSVLKVTLHAEPAPQRRVQGGLFVPAAPEAEKLELTIARLVAVAGEGNVGSPELLNTHRPDSFCMNRFVAHADRSPAEAPGPAVPSLAIRLYRPPLPAEVIAPLGYPQRVKARGVTGNVIGYAGPWRTSGEWWRPNAWARDEWDIALDDGAVYRLSRELQQPAVAWSITGNYD